MKEIWKDIPDYEGSYQVSDLGNVRSLDRVIPHNGHGTYKRKGSIFKPCNNVGGYLLVVLSKNRKQKTHKVHQLVAIAFLGHKPCGMTLVVDHLDDNKLNNRADNLQLVTNRENLSRIGGSSKYVGVSFFKKNNKWRADIHINGKRNYLGLFKKEIEASQAYKLALNSL
tara:strand:+ start:392 stop:898 length:507 start_codon:yes stop_codon:yes gene_type:complete